MLFLIARIVALILIGFGCVFMLRSETIKKVLDYVKQGNRIYGIGVLRILIGLVFLSVSSGSRITWVVVIIGLVVLGSGVAIFVLKKDRSLALAEKIHDMPGATLNLIGTIPLFIGILLLCSL